MNSIFKVQELFASVHQDLMVTHSFDAMTILVQLTPVAPTLIVKHKETELFVDAEKVIETMKLQALMFELRKYTCSSGLLIWF